MKRLVLVAVSAVVSCSSVVVAAAGTSSAAAAGGATMTGAPLMRAGRAPGSSGPACTNPCLSSNWSGYAQSAGRRTYTEVTDTFAVPTASADGSGTQYAADWVGIGGFSDPTLIQAGFQTVVKTTHKKTTVAYGAWTETLPQAEDPLSLTISPGDIVTVTVQETAKNKWTMTVDDVTTGQSGVRSVKYRSKGMSAEAIHERPCIESPCSSVNNLAQLAQTSDVTFDPGYFSVAPAGAAPVNEPLLTTGLPGMSLYEVIMTANNFVTPIATPSGPNSADDGFTVADGAVAPPPPS